MKKMVQFTEHSILIMLMKMCGLLLLSASIVSAMAPQAGYKPKQWCVVDDQVTDDVLQKALDWACGPGHADCSAIQPNMPCYLPNTVKHHASFAFNNYWQKFKKQGATCDFRAAAMVTDIDPSNGSCKYEVTL